MAKKCEPECSCGRHSHTLRTSYEKTCPECGTSFTAKRIDATYCSHACYTRYYEREHAEQARATRRRWQAANRERRRASQRKFSEQNRERIRAERQERYDEVSADPERAEARRESNRDYYQKNRERILAQVKKRREQRQADRRRNEHGTEWEPLLAALWQAQEGNCYLCGEPLRPDEPRAIHLDHDHECCPLGRSCERCRRGLACKNCNLIIGLAAEDPDRLERMAASLRAAKESFRGRMKLPRQAPASVSYLKACAYCGESFTASRSDARVCSGTCGNRLRAQEKVARETQEATGTLF